MLQPQPIRTQQSTDLGWLPLERCGLRILFIMQPLIEAHNHHSRIRRDCAVVDQNVSEHALVQPLHSAVGIDGQVSVRERHNGPNLPAQRLLNSPSMI